MRSAKYPTNEEIVEGRGWSDYVWGIVIAVYMIGDYAIIKYISNYGETNNEILFHPLYLDDNYPDKWRDPSTSYSTLERSLVGVIAHRYDGLNSQAYHFFCKMIGL
jgi:hypothetical protein